MKGKLQSLLQLVHRLHDLSVSPDPLKIIEQTVFLGEYVYDHIAVVHEYPCRAHAAFFLVALVTCLEELLLHVIN